MTSAAASTCPFLRPLLLALACAAVASPALAQYKVVDADGRVTYTDRPPAPSSGLRVTPVRADGSAAADPVVSLPLELRQAVARFPVTLYTTADCGPCDSGRRLLQERGVPYTERLIVDDADTDALMRLSNGRTVPTLTVGGQVMRGYAENDWRSTLDLAGYPRESRLPRGYTPPEPTPLVARAPVPVAAAAPERRELPPSPPVEPPAPDSPQPAIRF